MLALWCDKLRLMAETKSDPKLSQANLAAEGEKRTKSGGHALALAPTFDKLVDANLQFVLEVRALVRIVRILVFAHALVATIGFVLIALVAFQR